MSRLKPHYLLSFSLHTSFHVWNSSFILRFAELFIHLCRLAFLHLPISVFKWLSLYLSSVSFTWSCLFFIRLQAVQGCSVCWQGILKEHVWTRKPNLIPGLPLRVEDVKPTGYVVSSRKREDTQKDVGGGRRWRNCQWYREKILLDAGSKPAEIYTSLF
jgi:hypothetical protein